MLKITTFQSVFSCSHPLLCFQFRISARNRWLRLFISVFFFFFIIGGGRVGFWLSVFLFSLRWWRLHLWLLLDFAPSISRTGITGRRIRRVIFLVARWIIRICAIASTTFLIVLLSDWLLLLRWFFVLRLRYGRGLLLKVCKVIRELLGAIIWVVFAFLIAAVFIWAHAFIKWLSAVLSGTFDLLFDILVRFNSNTW